MSIDKEKLRDVADLRELTSSGGIFGVNTDFRGKKLCPFHSDTKGGNFGVEKDVFNCLACGEGGDVFSYVQKKLGCSFSEALKELAEYYGGIERFSDDPVPQKTKNGKQKLKFLTDEEHKAIGLFHGNGNVKEIKNISSYKDKELIEKYGKPEFIFDNDEDEEGSYIYYSMQRVSLFDLYRDNYECYLLVVRDKLREALESMVLCKENLDKNILLRKIKREVNKFIKI